MIHIVRKSTPRFTKSPSLVLIRLVLTEIQRFKNFRIYKEMYGHPDAMSDSLDRMATLVPEVFFSLGATELSRDCESRSGEKKTSGTNG